MSRQSKLPYQICREAAGYTQERASEMLNIATRTLSAYESGELRVPDDVACDMVTLYSAPFLAVQHLRLSSRLACSVVPDLRQRDLTTAAIRLVNRVIEFADEHRDRQLLRIAEDGRIDEAERPLFESIMTELDELVRAGTEVKMAKEKGNQE